MKKTRLDKNFLILKCDVIDVIDVSGEITFSFIVVKAACVTRTWKDTHLLFLLSSR